MANYPEERCTFMSCPIVIDLRSDTVTKPTPEMLQAMVNAEVGDDVYNDDPTVHELEHKLAKLCGKEAGLFVCSGVMSNQIALRCHLQPMQEVICDHRAHVYRSEQGGVMFHSGASILPITPEDGLNYITAKEIEPKINNRVDYHTPITRVISLENTLAGTVMPIEEIKAINQVAKKHGIIMHLDGARIWNASVVTGVSLETYGQYFDSISLCLSKGLGAPIGSVLVGNKEFIALARRYRKLFGGGWRQAGVLAAAGIYAVDNIWPKLLYDHENAKKLEKGLSEMGFTITVPVESNFVFASGSAIDFSFKRTASYLRSKGIALTPNAQNEYLSRLAIHHQITSEHIDTILCLIHDLIANRFIYRAVSKKSFEEDKTESEYLGTEIERQNGFLHFSTCTHIAKTIELYFSGVTDLLLLKIDTHKLPRLEDLRWEQATSDRGTDLFPHLYNRLPLDAIISQYMIPYNEQEKNHKLYQEELK